LQRASGNALREIDFFHLSIIWLAFACAAAAASPQSFSMAAVTILAYLR
jgi:hypothetical protein